MVDVACMAAPVPGAASLNNLVTARNGLIYGIAGRALFALNPETREMKMRRELPFSGAIYNAMEQGPDGNLWGVASSGIFRIDPDTSDAVIVAIAPKRI